MKSGLEDRNNFSYSEATEPDPAVSMKSGLEDRNNPPDLLRTPEPEGTVSMKSDLEDRNNPSQYQNRSPLGWQSQ